MPFVGWDWASKSHDVTVIDDRGRVLDRWAFSHTEQAWTTTLARLARHGDPRCRVPLTKIDYTRSPVVVF
ncbi:IS110 family transposase [Nocardia sp. SC052]|uniref:IS110 family transposase n=1 Tax=Nocardia sichangensis TaxID=3385975 RepID=UPI0039A35F4F